MIFSEQEIARIEKMAALFLKISDIADVLGVSAVTLRSAIKDRMSPVSVAYRRGKATSKYNIAAREMELANLGSPLGIENTRQSLIEMEDDE